MQKNEKVLIYHTLLNKQDLGTKHIAHKNLPKQGFLKLKPHHVHSLTFKWYL